MAKKKLKKPVKAKKMSSYKKLKKENQELKDEIYILVRKPFTLEAAAIRIKWDSYYKAVDSVWNGDTSKVNTRFNGIATLIKAGRAPGNQKRYAPNDSNRIYGR